MIRESMNIALLGGGQIMDVFIVLFLLILMVLVSRATKDEK
jgi:hypothetical protein